MECNNEKDLFQNEGARVLTIGLLGIFHTPKDSLLNSRLSDLVEIQTPLRFYGSPGNLQK